MLFLIRYKELEAKEGSADMTYIEVYKQRTVYVVHLVETALKKDIRVVGHKNLEGWSDCYYPSEKISWDIFD